MGTASLAQTSFLGGEWSKQMQGRFDREDYRTGLNLCLNIIPIEEGAAPRRSGTRQGGPTRSGNYAVLREYNVDQSQPYDIELTAGFLRIWQADANLVTEPGLLVTGITSADPAVFQVPGHSYSTGDQILFTVENVDTFAGIDQLLGRQFSVTVVDAGHFTVVDALTGANIDGTLINYATPITAFSYRIFTLTTPYTEDDLQDVRIVQDGTNALLLHHNYPPQTFVIETNSAGVFTDATFAPATFYDGPYLDIPSDGSTLTPSATSGSITFTISDITTVNNGVGLLSTDVGRFFRIFSEPLTWSAGSYSAGAIVKDAGVYWKAVQTNTVQPSTDNGTNWVIDTTGAAWTWGTIQSISASDTFVGTLNPAVVYPDNIAGGNLLYTNAAVAWQLGAYSATSGYPSVGAYYQGRVWLGGAQKNRFDACVSNDFSVNGYINFAPTGLDGTVADNNGIAGTLNAREIENFLWLLPDEQGVLAGTQSGEWIIASSSVGEPITPTSILTRETTHYGSFNTPSIKVGRATIFVHRDTRKVYEYMANYFTQKFVADNLSLKAKHLTTSGIAEIAYMRELTPVIWARRNDGTLIGCTYKHDDPIKPMEFDGWHQHKLGTNRSVISIQGGPANGGETDTLSMVTQDPITGFCYVEFLQTIWDDDDNLLTAWYLDGGAKVGAAERITNEDGSVVIRLYALWYMIGETVSVWGAGLDLGDFTVSAGATIDVPLNIPTSLLTDDYLADVTALGCTSLSTDLVGDGMPSLVYIMAAKENYDPTRVSELASLTSYASTYMNTDQKYQGVQWDAVRRNLMYMYTENTPNSPTTNTTGYHIWDGETAIAPGGAVNHALQFNSSVAVKNIDTGQVGFHLNYASGNVVPSGIGGSDGTYRRYTNEFRADNFLYNGNGPGMTDPYTGNFWIDSQSCELYCFRLADEYTQIISPLFPVHNDENNVKPVGFTTTGATNPWTFAREINIVDNTVYLYLVPKDLTAAEISADYLLIYATYTYPTVVAPCTLWLSYNREVFDHSGNMYLFSCALSGGKNFKLYKFTVPTAANYPTAAVGGGFTDITPWSPSSGPNGDGAAYTLARGSSKPLETADVIAMYLPATDDLVLIEKFFPQEMTANSTDPALMFWSCTYVHDPDSDPVFDHHSKFVTGYMTPEWVSTDINGAGYAVYDAFEVNNYLGQSDYDYTAALAPADYTTRWFFFVCRKVVGGVVQSSPRIVLVEYSFVYGSAPSVLQVIDEQGWDDAYPDYAPQTDDVYAPYNPVGTPAVAVSMATLYLPNFSEFTGVSTHWDNGIYDPPTNSFWWSGGSINSAGTLVPFCRFDKAFADRMQTADGTPGGSSPAATPPFMKLSFANSYCAPFVVGSTFISQGQILRPATPSEGMAQTGPIMGKKRRTAHAAPLLANAQGVSMGVDFLKMRPLEFKSPGGTIDLPLTQTFSGVYWGQVDADSNYDNMWCWQITRPYPCTMVAVEIQHKANENV